MCDRLKEHFTHQIYNNREKKHNIRIHTLTEKRKVEKRKTVRTYGKTEADKRNVPPTTTANSGLRAIPHKLA